MLCRFGAAGRCITPRSTKISRESLILLHPLLLQVFVYPGHGLAKKVSGVWCIHSGSCGQLEQDLFPEQK